MAAPAPAAPALYPPAAAGLLPEQLRHHLSRGNALRQRVHVVTVGGHDAVIRPEQANDSGRHSLLWLGEQRMWLGQQRMQLGGNNGCG